LHEKNNQSSDEVNRLKDALFNMELMLSLENEKTNSLTREKEDLIQQLDEQVQKNQMMMEMGGGYIIFSFYIYILYYTKLSCY
jgi:hypothetical protein